MARNGLVHGFEDASFYARAIIAWHTIDRKLDSYMLPTLDYETCFCCTREEVAAHARTVLPDHVFDPDAFARHVVASRQPLPVQREHLDHWASAFDYCAGRGFE